MAHEIAALAILIGFALGAGAMLGLVFLLRTVVVAFWMGDQQPKQPETASTPEKQAEVAGVMEQFDALFGYTGPQGQKRGDADED